MQLGTRSRTRLQLWLLAVVTTCALAARGATVRAADADAPAGARRSLLQVRLVGTAVGADGTSHCVIEDLGDQRQVLYRLGDAVQGGARIARIEWQRVILMRDGEEEVLDLAGDGQASSVPQSRASDLPMSRLPAGHLQRVGDNQFVVDRGEFEQVLQVAMAQFPQQIRAEPYHENGRLIGYRVAAVNAGGLFAQLGLRDGDVVRRINTADFANPHDGGHFPDLRSVPELTIEVLRGDAAQVLRYRFR